MLSLIGLTIVAVAEYLFVFEAVSGSTNWSIYYFASNYIAWTLIAIDVLFKDRNTTFKAIASSFIVFFLLLASIELSFINTPFEQYFEQVNDCKIRGVNYSLLVVLLIFIVFISWRKKLFLKLVKSFWRR